MVDSKPGDYATLLQSAEAGNWRFTFLATGRDALRLESIDKTRLWFVNVCLPDFSGWDLCKMLRPHLYRIPVCLVGDQYSVEEELRSYSARATTYVCKPLDDLWFQQWCIWATSHSRSPPPATSS